MSNFNITITDDNGDTVSSNFNVESWIYAFPYFLNIIQGCGYYVDDGIKLYIPKDTISKEAFSDKEYLIFEEDSNVDNSIKLYIPKDTISAENASNINHRDNTELELDENGDCCCEICQNRFI